MADTYKLFYNDVIAGAIDLIFDSASQTVYKQYYASRLRLQETEVLVHSPDFGESQPIRAIDLDRVFFLTLDVIGGGDDDVLLDAIARLRRWVDGADQLALRGAIYKWEPKVKLRTQLDGSTNHTDHLVKWGFVDDGSAIHTAFGRLNNRAHKAIVALHLGPYGHGAQINLFNDLPNGAFLHEGTTSGTGHDWAQWGTSTRTLDTDIYLIGGQSQKVVVDASGQDGITSSLVTEANANDNVVAFGWVHIESGGDPITMALMDQSNNILDSQATDDAGVKTLVDNGGRTWYRLEAAGTLDGGDTEARLTFYRDTPDASAATTFYVDAAYMEVDQTVVPPAGWVGECHHRNRGDWSTSNDLNVFWLDAGLMPGDVNALVNLKFESLNAQVNGTYASRWNDGRYPAAQTTIFMESAAPTSDTGDVWSRPTGSWSGGDAELLTEDADEAGGSQSFQIQGDSARKMFDQPKRIFMLVWTDQTLTRYRIDIDGGLGKDVFVSPEVGVDDLSDWVLLDMGVVNHSIPPESPGVATTEPITELTINISGLTNGDRAYWDCFFFLPVREEYLVSEILTGTARSSGEDYWILGEDEFMISEDRAQAEPDTLGTLWEVPAGLTACRFGILHLFNSDKRFGLGAQHNIQVEIIPRTRHLLGAW